MNDGINQRIRALCQKLGWPIEVRCYAVEDIITPRESIIVVRSDATQLFPISGVDERLGYVRVVGLGVHGGASYFTLAVNCTDVADGENVFFHENVKVSVRSSRRYSLSVLPSVLYPILRWFFKSKTSPNAPS